MPVNPDMIPLIDALLPQTQCTQCGYAGCYPYAQAISKGVAINRCPPGGESTIQQLAELLNQPAIPLDSAHGQTKQVIAWIREADCIGCTKCIQACPVDAIIGAAQQMHTVIAQNCTGCELCIAPCPVDCIELLPRTSPIPQPADLRKRFQQRQQRLQNTACHTSSLPSDATRTADIMNIEVEQTAKSPTESSEIDALTAAHTRYSKAEKLWKDAERAMQQAYKRGHTREAYQAKLDRLAQNAQAAKIEWQRLC